MEHVCGYMLGSVWVHVRQRNEEDAAVISLHPNSICFMQTHKQEGEEWRRRRRRRERDRE